MNSRLFLLLATFFLLNSCKKDKDDVFPTIIISAPTENSTYNVLEAIPLRISITDNEKIESVRISLSEQSSGKSALSSLSYYPAQSSFNLDEFYFISDSLLNTGKYSLRVDASDGDNSASAFSTVIIQGIDRKSLQIIAAIDGGQTDEIIAIQKDQLINRLLANVSVGEVHVNSRYQQSWFSQPGIEKIASLNLASSLVDYEAFPNSNGQSDRILDAEYIGDRFYVSTDRGTLQAFSTSYQDVFTYNSPTGFRVRNIYNVNNRPMVKETDLVGNNQSLIYLFNNGSIDTRINESNEIIGVTSKSSDPTEAHLFVNGTNSFIVKTVDLNSGLSNSIASKNNIQLKSVIRTRDFEFILITNSEVLKYNLSTGFLRAVSSSLSNPKAIYDEVDEVIYVASGNSLKAYDYDQLSLVFNSTLPNPIIDMAMHYNK